MRIETAPARIHKRCCELNRSTSKPTYATAGIFRARFSMGNQIQAYLPRGSNPTELERLCFQAVALGALLSILAGFAVAWVQTRRLAESHRAQEELEKSSRVLEEERRVLGLIARGASLKEVLDALTGAIERMAPNCFCTILLLDEDGHRLRKGSGGGLPAEYMQAIDGLEIGPQIGACGTAAYTNETTIVEDIAKDARFAPVKDFVISFGLRACWSVPIRDSNKKVLGTFAMYHQRPARPRERELRVVEAGAHLAGNAIERLRAEQRLREDAERFDLAEKTASFGVWQVDTRTSQVTVSEGFAALVGLAGQNPRESRSCAVLPAKQSIDGASTSWNRFWEC